MTILDEIVKYDNIIVQCHDNPDADALASGYALTTYLKSHGKKISFIYGGKFRIQKSNIVKMMEKLKIPVDYVTSDKEVIKLLGTVPELLVTVDCQYGQGNVAKFNAKNIAVIDHHQISGELPKLSDVRPSLGSCSTIIWDLIKDKADVNSNLEVSTALYYGLITDTNGPSGVHEALDREMRDSLKVKRDVISILRNSNISKYELDIAGKALQETFFLDDLRTALVETAPCDPNILGIISDLVLEVDTIDSCIVYFISQGEVKLSIRSCVEHIKANYMAAFITGDLGSGGGHSNKAGGSIWQEKLEERGVIYSSEGVRKYLVNKLNEFLHEKVL